VLNERYNKYIKILVANCEGDSIIKIHGIRLNNNIKMSFKEMGCDSVDWVGLVLV
jgi:hypothetical protein